ncbi:MAG: hypothetical protein IPM24_00075 [Bryobacterales bacterium]|nr:hypothetical protein [Bryobacterales bacterium]
MRSSLLLPLLLAFPVWAGEVTIPVDTPMTPPAWALLERELLRANSRAVEVYAENYLDSRGYLLHYPRWGTLDGADDAAEAFYNWTLLHALGGSDNVLGLFRKGLEGHLLQYKELKTFTTDIAKDGAYYKEFLPMSDWFHNGEGLRGFVFQGLSEPVDKLYGRRMRRYAGFYMNEDPDAPNYDPQHKIIKSIWTGSKGPMLRRATKEDWVGDPAYGRFHLLHGGKGAQETVDFEEYYLEMLEHCSEYLDSVGDHPLNLAATNLALNAYMLGHEKKYRDWLLEYVDAWKERIASNGGNIPTNIGLDGKVGGEYGGKWYKGTYGWNFTIWSPEYQQIAHRNTFDAGSWPGFSNAFLLTGDPAYIAVLRRQMDNIHAQKKMVDGKEMVPQMYGEHDGQVGWYHWTPNMFHHRLAEIYMWSMDRADLERVPKTGWIGYLEGMDDAYPETALRRDLDQVRKQIEEIHNDPTSPDTRLADWVQIRNPVQTNALTNLTMGSYLTGNIWTLHARVRYFDPARRRSGLPEDVAALVEKLTADSVTLTLVNTSHTDERLVAVQAGGYGEHHFDRVTVNGRTTAIDHPYVNVHLAPGAGARFEFSMKRYAHQPTLAQPWERSRLVRK